MEDIICDAIKFWISENESGYTDLSPKSILTNINGVIGVNKYDLVK